MWLSKILILMQSPRDFQQRYQKIHIEEHRAPSKTSWKLDVDMFKKETKFLFLTLYKKQIQNEPKTSTPRGNTWKQRSGLSEKTAVIG